MLFPKQMSDMLLVTASSRCHEGVASNQIELLFATRAHGLISQLYEANSYPVPPIS